MSEAGTSAAVNQLAFFWARQDDASKAIFEELYREAPEVVLRVLTRGELTPDETHSSIGQIVAPAGEGQLATVALYDVTVNPPFPSLEEPFAITWKRHVTGELPAHTDSIQIIDSSGAAVVERTMPRDAAADGASDEQSETFDPLGVGEYQVMLWGNLEGGDGTGVPTAQGLRGWGDTRMFVGDSAGAQAAADTPAVMQALAGVSEAYNAAYELAQEFEKEKTQGAGSADFDRLAMWDTSLRNGLRTAIQWLREVQKLADPYAWRFDNAESRLDETIPWDSDNAEELAGTSQRLGGLAQMNAAEQPQVLADAIVDIVTDLYGR